MMEDVRYLELAVDQKISFSCQRLAIGDLSSCRQQWLVRRQAYGKQCCAIGPTRAHRGNSSDRRLLTLSDGCVLGMLSFSILINCFNGICRQR